MVGFPPSSSAKRLRATDTPCINCGYNLRGSSLEDLCPECGTPVSKSGIGLSLSQTPRHWLRQLGWGLFIIVVSPLTGVVLAMVAVIIARVTGGLPNRWWVVAAPGPTGMQVIWVLRGVLLAWLIQVTAGILLLTSREPRLRYDEAPLNLRRTLRLAGPALLLASTQSPLVSRVPALSWLPSAVVQSVGTLAVLLLPLLMGLYAGQVMGRFGFSDVARKTRWTGFAFAVGMAGAAAVELGASLSGWPVLGTLQAYGIVLLPAVGCGLLFWAALEWCRRIVKHAGHTAAMAHLAATREESVA